MDKQKDADEKLIEEVYESLRGTKEYNELRKSMLPLVEAIRTSDALKESIKQYASSLKGRFGKSATRMRVFREDAKAEAHTEITTLRKAFVYLGLFESSVTNLIDLILMIFIVNGHDFYIYSKRTYAKKLEDLDHANLWEKLVFLNHHGLQLFSQNLNKSLRNIVAHMDFDIEPDGRISVGEQKYDLEREITYLSAFVLIITEVLKDCGVPEIWEG